MECSYKPKGSQVYDPYDRVLQHGSRSARIKGMQLDKVSKNKLSDIFQDGGPLCFGYGELEMAKIVSGSVKPINTLVKTVYVSGVQAGNDYVTFCFKPGVNEWVEVEPDIHQPTALVGVLYQEYKKVAASEQELKKDKSQLQLEISLLRHELERARPTTRTLKPISVTRIVMFGLLIGLLLAHATSGFRTGQCLDSDVSETLKPQTCINWKWDGGIAPDTDVPFMERLSAWYTGFKQQVREYYTNSAVFEWMLFMTGYLCTWTAVATLIGAYYMFRADNPLYMLLTIALATVSKIQLLAIAAVPSMEITSTFSLWSCMVVYYFNQVAAMCASLIITAVCLVVCMFMSDVEYIQLIRGHGVVILTIFASHLFHILQVPSWVTIVIMVSYRVAKLTSFIFGEKIEARGLDGKIVATIPSQTSWLNKVSRFVQGKFRQGVRTGISSTARVIPNGVVTIETKETVGTGFRVQNYIVTAAHVVGNETQVRVKWGDVSAFAKVCYIHPEKDVAYLTLPSEHQGLPTYKFAKNIVDGTVVITSLEECGTLAVAITEGVVVSNNMTYAVNTKNGMSGSPVTNVDGRIVGVHQTNTGFTGGAVILYQDDLPPQKKPLREQELEARIKDLEAALDAKMQQRMSDDQIVELVRLAVGRELTILRHELSLNQAKGKNKGKKGGKRGKKKRMWTEEEYKELLEKGFTKQQLRDMAEALREAEYSDEDSDEYEAGYPQWSDPEDDDELEAEWFGPKKKILDEVEEGWSKTDFWEQCQKVWKELEPMSEEAVNTLPSHLNDKYGITCYVITKADMEALAKDLQKYQMAVEDKIKANVIRGQWMEGVDPKTVINELDELWLGINHIMWENGLVPFTQRKKINRRKQAKNLKGGPRMGPQQKTN
ncbi:ORF1a [Astrovirus VA4]|uniref:ORF1a n=1 Tax=Astrovirus VA4 TaxID=1247113 RepID=UPI000292DD26|nr:ORF1a [Astrovirus VA4]AFV53439.1 ORF1a [Astrovirus VA4]